MKFCSSGEKMSNASDNQGEKRTDSEKKQQQKNTQDMSSIKRVTAVTGKFVEVYRCSRAKQRQRIDQKSALFW